MAHSRSAIKRIRITRERTARNRKVKASTRTAIKQFLADNRPEDMEQRFRSAIRAIDRAVTKGVMHKNTAARRKSRIAKRYQALRQAQ